MKRQRLIVGLALLVVALTVASTAVMRAGSVLSNLALQTPDTAAPAAQAQKAKDNGDTIVYLTKTGAKYHKASCSSLRKSTITITLREAINRGYGPCKNCRPPVLTSK